MSRYRVIHKTLYFSHEPVSVAHNEARIQPRRLPYQNVEFFKFDCQPTASAFASRVDYFGNSLKWFSFHQGYYSLEVVGTSEVEVFPRAAASWSHAAATGENPLTWRNVREVLWSRPTDAALAACEFLFDSPRIATSETLAEYGRPSFAQHELMLPAVMDLTRRIHEDFRYDPSATTVSTPLSEVVRTKRGVCQDFAHLQIGVLRSLGLAARYVSGYLRTIPPPGRPRMVGADASHAWVSVYCGPLGWVDVDPTNNLIVDTDHITLAFGRDYSDVPPLNGVYVGGMQSSLSVSVDVCPI